jgi:hypothetical protein
MKTIASESIKMEGHQRVKYIPRLIQWFTTFMLALYLECRNCFYLTGKGIALAVRKFVGILDSCGK